MSLTIEQTINQLVIQQVDGDTLAITTQGPQGPAGPSTTFTLAGNSGSSQTISNGDTLTLTSPVSFQQVVMSAVDTATFSWPDQTGNVFLASPANGSAGTPVFRTITFADLDAVLGTMAQQDANAVAITGGTMSAVAITLGTINNAPIGGTTPAAITGTQITATTGVTLPDGTAGTPSLNFTNNTNMGMYRFGAGEIGFSIGGNVAMQLNSVGLGLGTTAAVKLDLSSASATTIRVRTTTANNAQLHFIRTGTAEYAIGYNNADTSFRIANNATVGTNDRVIISTAGVFTHNETDAGTNNTVTTLILQRNSTGTPAANFASRIQWQLESSTTNDTNVANIETSWVVATHASRTVRQVENLTDFNATREIIRKEVNGSAALLSFYGETATIRYATTGTTTGFTAGAGAAVDSAATFTGNVGATAYTIGDIVRALKLVGIMTQ